MNLENYQIVNYAFKFTFILVCLTGMIYQVSLLMNDYFRGITVVSLKVKFLQIDSLPSFTICTRNFLSISKATKLYPTLQPYWKQYVDIYNEINKIGEKSKRGKELIQKNKDILQNITKTIDFTLISGYEIQENFSGNLGNNSMAYWQLYIVGMVADNGTLIEVNSFKQPEVMENQEYFPIESIKVEYQDDIGFDPQKCFTSFSFLNPYWREFKFKNDLLEIHFLPGPYWSPYYLFNEVIFSIHSQNTLPDLNQENFVKLQTDRTYDILYNQVQVELLGNGYDTNCYNYDLDYKYANFNMRSDCITNCFQKAMRKRCDLKDFQAFDQMLRRELLLAHNNMSITNGSCGGKLKTRAECFNECRPDCKYKYYLWDKKENRRDEGHDLFINMRHSRVPDVIIKYSPQISFISFVCSFGGLLGMWLGLSILTIFDRTSKYLLKFANKAYHLGYYENVTNTTNLNFKPKINLNVKVVRPHQSKWSKASRAIPSIFDYSPPGGNTLLQV